MSFKSPSSFCLILITKAVEYFFVLGCHAGLAHRASRFERRVTWDFFRNESD
jgi:hypothetical protein